MHVSHEVLKFLSCMLRLIRYTKYAQFKDLLLYFLKYNINIFFKAGDVTFATTKVSQLSIWVYSFTLYVLIHTLPTIYELEQFDLFTGHSSTLYFPIEILEMGYHVNRYLLVISLQVPALN